MREKILFDNDWLFCEGDIDVKAPTQKGPIYTSAKTERAKWGPACKDYVAEFDSFEHNIAFGQEAWVPVSLPHDYTITQTPDPKKNNALGYFEYKNAWYRKKFTLSDDDKNKRITLLFDGISHNSTVYLNGCLMKHNFCGYTSFEVDITDVVRFDGENVLAVYIDSKQHEGWWYEGCGIYRHVWLIKTDTIAVDLWGLYAMPQKSDDALWNIPCRVTVLNTEYNDADVTVNCYVSDNNGNVVATASSTEKINLRSKKDVHISIDVENPMLWDTENPVLYTVKAVVATNGKERDTLEVKTGFRTFKATPDKGLFLNDKHITIKGVCSHQDFGITGRAVPDNIHKHKVKLIKEMGANGFRCSHYPHCEATMDALDEMGFIVMAETRWFESTPEGIEQLEMLIKRDRNRPSICFWSVGNEEMHHTTEQGRRICKSMMARVKQLDNTRIVMSAVSNDPDVATVYDELDAIGINYNLDKFDKIHEKYPDKPIFSSECCATGTTRGWYHDDCAELGYISAYDKDSTAWFLGREKTWKFLTDRKWVMGGYQWIAFEHRGETYWPRLCSQSGAIDLFLQKKDAFYQNQALWIENKPIIHLMPHWNFEGYEGEEISVWAYTNCEEAELFLNEKSLGRIKTSNTEHGEWRVPYSSGKLSVIGYNRGKAVCEDVRETTGKAQSLELRAENEAYANGKDILLLSCYCKDENGKIVPDADAYVTFSCNSYGKIVGTGSDVSDHTPPSSLKRKMRAGFITVAVKTNEKEGILKVYAESQNLKSAVISVSIKAESK